MACVATLRRGAAAGLALAVSATLAGGCSSGHEPSESGYCALIGEHETVFTDPTIVDQASITSTVDLYQQITDASPLAIQAEWTTMLASIRVAAAVDPSDPPSVQKAADAARESQVAANRVITYTQQHCSLTLGPPGNTAAPTTTDSVPGS
jgi:hypothetical protein